MVRLTMNFRCISVLLVVHPKLEIHCTLGWHTDAIEEKGNITGNCLTSGVDMKPPELGPKHILPI